MASPYNYFFNEQTQSYNFTTKNEIEYAIFFRVDDMLSNVFKEPIENVYHFVIEKITDGIVAMDSQIADTINGIVSAFFVNSQDSLLYFCSDDDERAEKRFKAFERWYQKGDLPDSVLKVDKILQLEEVGNYYSSLLYHKDNENSAKILAAYDKLFEI